MNSNFSFKVFREGNIKTVLEGNHQSILKTIERETENFILNVNQTEYVNHLKAQFQIDFPTLHFSEASGDSYEKEIPAEKFPSFTFNVEPGRRYKKTIIEYYIPFSGDIQILKYAPYRTFTMGGGGIDSVKIKDNYLVIEVVDFYNDPVKISEEYHNCVKGITRNYSNLKDDCDNYNSSLELFIEQAFEQRKKNFLKKNNTLEALGIPVRKRDSTPKTFSIPSPTLRQKVSIKPVVYEKGYKPEPTLDDSTYLEILKIINDVGKNFERLPSVFRGKDEETLRDHFILVLDPNFEYGTVTGETFNKKGKTDILIRYESSNVFVAECKFWKGEKQLELAIDQLLGYLTWRDSKAALIIFSTNKDFSNVLDKVHSAIKSHSNFLGEIAPSDLTWLNYRLHLPGDKNREVKLATMVYNIPE